MKNLDNSYGNNDSWFYYRYRGGSDTLKYSAAAASAEYRAASLVAT